MLKANIEAAKKPGHVFEGKILDLRSIDVRFIIPRLSVYLSICVWSIMFDHICMSACHDGRLSRQRLLETILSWSFRFTRSKSTTWEMWRQVPLWMARRTTWRPCSMFGHLRNNPMQILWPWDGSSLKWQLERQMLAGSLFVYDTFYLFNAHIHHMLHHSYYKHA